MKSLILVLSLFSFVKSAQADSSVSSDSLSDLLRRCSSAQDDRAEVKCLRRGISRLVNQRRPENEVLECRSNGSDFALYNRDKNVFVDQYYSKTASQCTEAIDEATSELVCVSSSSGAAIYNYAKGEFVDKYYAKTLEQCYQTIRGIRRDIVCLANSGSFARFNLSTNQFLDSRYSLSLDECLSLAR